MFYQSNNFKLKAAHIFCVKESPIEVRRKKWREEELEKRKLIFTSVISTTPWYTKIYNFIKNINFGIDKR